MEITIVIVLGITLITAISMAGDYLTKTKVAKLTAHPKAVQGLQERVEVLEARLRDQEAKVVLLEDNLAFTAKLLEKKP